MLFFSDLTLIPPPITPDDEEALVDFCGNLTAAPVPAGFNDSPDNSSDGLKMAPACSQAAGGEGEGDEEGDIPAELADLPASVREQIDALVMSDADLGSQLASMDAVLLAGTSNRKLSLRS